MRGIPRCSSSNETAEFPRLSNRLPVFVQTTWGKFLAKKLIKHDCDLLEFDRVEKYETNGKEQLSRWVQYMSQNEDDAICEVAKRFLPCEPEDGLNKRISDIFNNTLLLYIFL